jgi:hypothetical protein
MGKGVEHIPRKCELRAVNYQEGRRGIKISRYLGLINLKYRSTENLWLYSSVIWSQIVYCTTTIHHK